jgi:hypothetical protein
MQKLAAQLPVEYRGIYNLETEEDSARSRK